MTHFEQNNSTLIKDLSIKDKNCIKQLEKIQEVEHKLKLWHDQIDDLALMMVIDYPDLVD